MRFIVVDPLFEQFFEAAQYFYWCMPLNPYRLFSGPVSTREFVLGRVCFYSVLFSQLLLLVLNVVFLVDAVTIGKDALIIADTLLWLILDINAIYFLFFSRNSANDIVALLHQLHECFPKPENKRSREIATNRAKGWSSMMNLQTALFNTSLVGVLLMPIVWSFVGYFQTSVWTNKLPINMWFPFDEFSMPAFALVYLLEIWLGIVSTLIILAPIKLLGACTMLICLQFKNVADSFLHIKLLGIYRDDLPLLRDVILRHNQTLVIADQIRKVFSIPLLVVFGMSSIFICIFMFLTVNIGDGFTRLQNAANLVAFLLFCWCNSYIGNELIEHVG